MSLITLPNPDEIHDLETAREIIRSLCDVIRSLEKRIENLEVENAQLRRAFLGPRSERLTSIQNEIHTALEAKATETPFSSEGAKRLRRSRAEGPHKKKRLLAEEVKHGFSEGELHCPYCECKSEDFRALGQGEISFEYEYIPPRFKCLKHIRQKMRCACGATVMTAPGPQRVSENVVYGPGMHAQVIVSKCADAIPLNRQAKALQREGLPVCRSTLCDLFHRAATLLEPIHTRMKELIPQSGVVNADETSIPVQQKGHTRRAFIWTFIADAFVVYEYSANRSGETPSRILGESSGFLQVDGYSGYNHVTTPEKRTRVGCLAHARRYFWAALEQTPNDARYALDQILELYLVEYEAAEKKLLGTEAHGVLRQERSQPVMEAFHQWLEQQQPLHPPKSPMGQAIGYALNQWEHLILFLTDFRLSLDNNISERMLRIIALGRKNFLFVGHDEAGEHLAMLQSLVATCEMHQINPQQYISDVLIRIQTHPASRLDELLPHRWKELIAPSINTS
jgi:transposase